MVLKFDDFLGRLRVVSFNSLREISTVKLDRLMEEAIRFFNLTNSRIEEGIKNLSSFGIAYSFANLDISNEEVLASVFPEGTVELHTRYESGKGYRIEFCNKECEEKILYSSSIEFLEALREFNELCKFVSRFNLGSITSYVRYSSITKETKVAVFDDLTQEYTITPTELELITYEALNLDSPDLSYFKDVKPEEVNFEVVRKGNKDFLCCGKKNRCQAMLSTDFDGGYLFRIISDGKSQDYTVSNRDFKDLIHEFNNVSYLINRLLNIKEG